MSNSSHFYSVSSLRFHFCSSSTIYTNSRKMALMFHLLVSVCITVLLPMSDTTTLST